MSQSPWDHPVGTGTLADPTSSGHGPDTGWSATNSTADRGSRPKLASLGLANLGPRAWLVATVVCLGISGWLWATQTLGRNLAGYIAAGIGATTFVALFRQADVAARASRNYEYQPMVTAFAGALLVASLCLAGVHIWPLASEWSRE